MHPFLRHSSVTTKIFFLFLSAFIGILLMQIFLSIVAQFIDLSDSNSVVFLRTTTFLQGLLMFLLPTILIAKWSGEAPVRLLKIAHTPSINRTFWISVVLIVVSAPMIGLLSTWNKQLALPASMEHIESWMRQMEDSAMAATNTLLGKRDAMNLLINLLLVAGFAALTEEFFFRGALQQLLQQWTQSGHAAVWLAACLFSAMHVQFFGFFPRLILGALLGYIFLYTRNLWMPIIVHFLNNAMAIIAFYRMDDAADFSKMDEYPTDFPFLFSATASAALTVYMLFLLRKHQKLLND